MFSLSAKNRFRKTVSAFLIFAIFALQTFQIPLSTTSAASSDVPNIVSIIVNESTNSFSTKSRIKRYADDIQSSLENTRVVIVEVPDNVAPHNIATLNERLYYEGDGNGPGRLVGTVLIGDIPLPVVHRSTDTFLSVFPYVDFDQKVFIFDAAKGYYEFSKTTVLNDVPEIWHGVIMPNTGSKEQDNDRINAFLDKSHDYYTKQGKFEKSLSEPYVFYLDAYHDQQSSLIAEWNAYKTYLDNIEEISYNRFNKYLAKKLYDSYQEFMAESDGVAIIGSGSTAGFTEDLLKQLQENSMDFSTAPDIQTRTSILKSVKQFFEFFNEKHIGDILKAVYNTGRYGDARNVRVDLAPVLVSKQDELMKQTLKDANTFFEASINQIVKNGLSMNIALGTSIDYAGDPTYWESPKYRYYLFGQKAEDITSAEQCTIVRGSSLPTEANRGYNVFNSENDAKALSDPSQPPFVGDGRGLCFNGSQPQTMDTWGGNTPLNLDIGTVSPDAEKLIKNLDTNNAEELLKAKDALKSKIELKSHVYSGYISPTFDLGGSKEIVPNDTLKIASPEACLKGTYISDPYRVTDSLGMNLSWPRSTNGSRFSCVMGGPGHKIMSGTDAPTFKTALESISRYGPTRCVTKQVTLDGKPIAGARVSMGWCEEGSAGDGVGGTTPTTSSGAVTFAFKSIPSLIEHVSPTDEEIAAAEKAMMTPSIAVDRDRYVTFFSPKGNTVKITYPNFYRLSFSGTTNPSFEDAKAKVKSILDEKSNEINGIINAENPSGLGGTEAKMYSLLSTGEYPKANVDLYHELEQNPAILNALVENVIWYVKRNATEKYAFLLEHDLDIDGNFDAPLAGHKSDYEMAYIGGLGSADHMALKVDPEAKLPLEASVADIGSDVSELQGLLDGTNASSGEKADFKCGPPEWVPIWEWLPAVFCWLGTILPPAIGAGSCGPSLSGKNESDARHFKSLDKNNNKLPDWQEDLNLNGIPDGYEWIGDPKSKLELTSSRPRISYNTNALLTATFTQGDMVLAHDSYNQVNFTVKRIDAYDEKWAKKVVYAKTFSGTVLGGQEVLEEYVSLSDAGVRAENGVAKYPIYAKNKDADIVVQASVSPTDRNGQSIFTKRSNDLVIEIRGDTLRVRSSIAKNGTSTPTTVIKAGETNAIDFTFQTFDKNGASLPLARPLTLQVIDDSTDQALGNPIAINSGDYTYKNDSVLTVAGTYRFEFTDTKGRFESVTFTVLPASPVRIDAIASSSVFVRGEKDTILVRAIDQYGNNAKGSVLKFKGSVKGGGYFTENNGTSLTKESVDGTTSFTVSSNNWGESENVTIELEGTDLKKNLTLTSVSDAKIQVDVENRDNIVAGKEAHEVKLSVVDGNGKLIEGFSGVASLDAPANSGVFSNGFVSIKGGKNDEKILFTPKYVAAKNIVLDIQIPGLKTLEGNMVTVLPDAPIRVGMDSANTTIEAKTGNSSTVTAKLYDRYGNIAYNHASGLKANFSVSDRSIRYGSVQNTEVAFAEGIARTNVVTTATPGTIYAIVSVNPGLENTTFTVTDSKNGTTITIHGYSKNVVAIDTAYFWNKEKLQKTNYNALYTTLLGADYGNITTKDYLAGEILFAPESRSLAVTTLLNDPVKHDDLFSLTPGGKMTVKDEESLVEFGFETANGKTAISVYDPFLRDNVGKIHLNTVSDTPLVACSSTGSGIDECSTENNDRFILLKNAEGSTVTKGKNLWLQVNGVPVFSIDANGAITKYPSVSLEIDKTQSRNLLGIRIVSGTTEIGYLAIKWNANRIVISDSDNLAKNLSENAGVIVFERVSANYATNFRLLGNSSKWAQGIAVYSLKEEDGSVNRNMASQNRSSIESYRRDDAIGFGWNATNLLEFAGGATVGESTRFAATYGMVNMGDPVVKLSKLANGNNTYDQTIGKKINSNLEGKIENYATFDYNNDHYPDIAVFYDNGRIELIQNYHGSMKSLGYLAYVADAGLERKWAGDFAKDGYGDIVLTDANGKLILLDNQLGKFERKTPRIFDASGSEISLSGSISQLAVFDMDQDGASDIIVSDSSGVLSILYGGSDANGLRFTQKILSTDLGLYLNGETFNNWGAIRWNGIYEVPSYDQTKFFEESSKNTNASDTGALSLEDQKRLLDSKIYYQASVFRTVPAALAADSKLSWMVWNAQDSPGTTNTALVESLKSSIADMKTKGTFTTSALDTTTLEEKRTYLRSEFAIANNIVIEKTYTDTNSGTLQGNDKIKVTLSITNSGSKALNNVSYLDSNDSTVFKLGDNRLYVRKIGSATFTGTLVESADEGFDLVFDGFSLEPKEKAVITYELVANPLGLGKFNVGRLESDDIYGDVSMNSSGVCGKGEVEWKSTNPAPRNYEKINKEFTATGAKTFVDENNNGIPDYEEIISSVTASGTVNAELQKKLMEKGKAIAASSSSHTSSAPSLFKKNSDGSVDLTGLSNDDVSKLSQTIDNIVQGLGCGFGGGSCFASPLNWAPLAPGSAPTAFGYPMGSLSPGTGIPLFSAFTMAPYPVAPPGYCSHFPTVWPAVPFGPSPLSAATFLYAPCGAAEAWGPLSWNAGGYMGTTGIINFFRFYVTPTITGAIGIAACFGPMPIITGNIPPKWVSPLIGGGNCIVAAKPLAMCKDDGSEGAVSSLGSFNNGFINANSCKNVSPENNFTNEEVETVRRYVAGDSSLAPIVNEHIRSHGGFALPHSPLIGIGGPNANPDFEVGIDTQALKNFDLQKVLKIKNTRISAFPDFIMDWVTRQLEEVVNKLTSLPTLYIILPDMGALSSSGWNGFFDKISGVYDKGAGSYKDQSFNVGEGKMAGFKEAKSATNDLLANQKDNINTAGRTVSGVKAAYEFMSRLPLLKFENHTVDVSVPILSENDVETSIQEYKGVAKQWETEIKNKTEAWKALWTKDGVDKSILLDASSTLSSINDNIRMLEEYKRFPEKFSKYLTWKQRYASQILCNVESVEKIMGGWIGENGKRFRAWVELVILLKSILKTWQIIPQLFINYDAECAVCRNERYDLKHLIFKLISAVIPKIPIIRFPKWPDIILDLHNVRLGLHILLPEFNYSVRPIILPKLPKLLLPNTPFLGFKFPSIPVLPALPPLPDLPNLPSLPSIDLPDLPPPPTIPKLFALIQATLNILKIVKKIICIMRSNPFVPEWRAGDQIAQITERQGKLNLDFLNIEFPQFSMSFIDAINVMSLVNLEFQADFILEMAKSTMQPFNSFTSDLSNEAETILPTVGTVNLQGEVPGRVDINVGEDTKVNGLQGANGKKLLEIFARSIALSFQGALKVAQKEANTELSLADFKEVLREGVASIDPQGDKRIASMKTELSSALAYDGKAEDEMIAKLLSEHKEKYETAKRIVWDDIRETERMEAEIREVMAGKKTLEQVFWTPKTNILIDAKTKTSRSFSEMDKFEQRAADSFLALTTPSENPLKADGDALLGDVRELTASASKSQAEFAAYEGNSWSGSESTPYEYRGIYLIDRDGQTRLFNYTEMLDGSETVTKFDRLNTGSGSEDLVFRIENGLYLKSPLEQKPSAPVTDSIKTYDLDDILSKSNTPSAPNNFVESFATPGEIRFDFESAESEKDSLFRLEFFDHIDRFDRMAGGEDIRKLESRSAQSFVDLSADSENERILKADVPGLTLRSQFAHYVSGRGEADYYGPELRTLQRNEGITVGENRTIYSTNSSARITYEPTDGSGSGGIMVLPKNSELYFAVSMKITVLDGSVLLVGDDFKWRTQNLSDLVGTPVFEGVQADLKLPGTRLDLAYFNGADLKMDGPASYELKSLGRKAKSYSVQLERKNSWYYGRLGRIDPKQDETRALITLFSPQTAADLEPPRFVTDKSIPIPVYQTRTFPLDKLVTDVSGIRDAYVDTDLGTDSNNDGDKENDRDSDGTGSVSRLQNLSGFSFGPYNDTRKIPMKLWATDGNGNTSSITVTVDVYAPKPKIETFSGGLIQWVIDEKLTNEPVDILRYRNGSIVRIGNTGKTDDVGAFVTQSSTASGVALRTGSGTIANIDEKRGTIHPSFTGAKISIDAATDKSPMAIVLKDASDTVLYKESFALPKSTPIGASGNGPWIDVVLSGDSLLARNASNASSLPNGAYITTKDHAPIVGIAADGNVYLLDNAYSLSYREEGGNVAIDVKRGSTINATIIYKINAEFIVK